MSVAMAVSTTIHLVAMVLVGRILTEDLFPSFATVPLLVHIDSRTAPVKTPADAATQRLTLPANELPPPNDRNPVIREQPTAREASGKQSSETSSVPEVEAGQYAETERDALSAARRLPHIDKPDAEDRSRYPALVHHEQSVKMPAAMQVQYSARQEKMLGRKVREWADELHGIPGLTKEVSWEDEGQEYFAKFTALPGDDDMSIERVLVEVTTLIDGNRLMSAMTFRRLAFSSFAQFVNRWDPNVEIHDDELDGRFHANSRIRLTYDRSTKPVFHSKVTTSARAVDITRNGGILPKSEIFLGGLETGVRTIQLPRHYVPFPGDVFPADADVHRLSEDTRINFLPDGSFTLENIDSPAGAKIGQLSHDMTYFLANNNASIHIRGVVDGKVLIYSPERIVLEGDVVYAQDPRIVPESDDYLGLISDRYIDVAAPDVTGPGDLVIHAAIYARRRFTVRHARSSETSELRLYGSLSAGTISATEPRYSTKIQYDQRLTEVRPPGFPLTDRYEVESWDKGWTMGSSH